MFFYTVRLVNHSIIISNERYNLTSLQHFVFGHWGMILFFCSEFIYSLSNCDAQLYKLFESPESVWFILSLSYQHQTGHVASLLSSKPSRLQHFCMFLSSAFKCDDNSHEQNTKTKTATCSKMRASPSRLISVPDSSAVCLTRRLGSFTPWHNSGCRGCSPPDPCHTISFLLFR